MNKDDLISKFINDTKIYPDSDGKNGEWWFRTPKLDNIKSVCYDENNKSFSAVGRDGKETKEVDASIKSKISKFIKDYKSTIDESLDEELLSETDYNLDDVKKQMAANEAKVKELLSKCDAPEAKEALKILKQNDKLLNRKGYFNYSKDEIDLRATRSIGKLKSEFDKNAGGSPEAAKALNKEYAGKTFKSDYDTVKINSIVYHDGSILVKGETDDGYGETFLKPYELKRIPELVKLANRINLMNDKSSRNFENDKWNRKEREDLSDKKRQEQLKKKKYFNY